MRLSNRPAFIVKGFCGCFGTAVLLLTACGRNFVGSVGHVAWADSISDAASRLLDAGKSSQALFFLDSAYRAEPGRGIAEQWRRYHFLSGYYKNFGHDPIARSKYIDSMFGLLQGKEELYRYEYCQTLFARADLLQSQQQYTQAVQYYYDGRNFAEGVGDTASLADFNNSIGLIFYRQNRYAQAIPFFKQALSQDTGCIQSSTFHYGFVLPQSMLNSIALCFERMGMADSAIFYYQQAANFISEKGRAYYAKKDFVQAAAAVVAGNLGGVYAEIGRWREAEEKLLFSIRVNDRPGYAVEDAQTARIKLADLYLVMHRYAEALAQLDVLSADLSSGVRKGSGNNEIWGRYYRLAWRYADVTGHTDEAYRAVQRYYSFKDSVERIGAGIKNTDIDQTFHEKEQRYQLSLLKKDDHIKTVYLVAAVAFLVTALAIVVYVWRNLLRMREHVRRLTVVNREYKRTLAALKKSQEDNIRMVKIAAHDLRSPVGVMLSGISLLMMDSQRRHPKDNELLRMLKTSAENALTLTSDLLQVNTKVEDFEKENIDMEKLIAYGVGLLQHKADEKYQTIIVNAKPVILHLSREKIWRVVSNLIDNAIKFSPTYSTITINLDCDARHAFLSVKDNGIGIPPELKEKVFDMFTNARRRGTGGEPSFGLGLAISRQIVEAHGGRIWFESPPGQGCLFSLALPFTSEQAD